MTKLVIRSMYQRKVDVDMLNAVKSMLADVSSVSSSSEQRRHLKIVIFIRFRMVNGQNRWVHINRPSRRIIFRWPSAKPFIWKLVSIHTCEKGLAFVFALKTSRHFELRQTRARRGEEQVQLSAAESVETVAVSCICSWGLASYLWRNVWTCVVHVRGQFCRSVEKCVSTRVGELRVLPRRGELNSWCKKICRLKETLSVLMLCAPSNRRRPFSYHTKMADFEYFRVLSVFSWNKLA